MACSSFEPRNAARSLNVAEPLDTTRPPNSDAEEERISDASGKRNPVGESSDCLVSPNSGGTLKKVDKKVYSAVELSMKTRNSDRKMASVDSFCTKF